MVAKVGVNRSNEAFASRAAVQLLDDLQILGKPGWETSSLTDSSIEP